jgi:hypothetical protein
MTLDLSLGSGAIHFTICTLAFQLACRMGLEGIVERRDKPYRSGRSADWIKVKNPEAPAATRVIEG